jgi:hypothetical protein
MNANKIVTANWSNEQSKRLYELKWPDNAALKKQYENGEQCGACSFFAALNFDYGLCCYGDSPHYLETVFEHFTCEKFVSEGWGPHSFTNDDESHCRCGGSDA